MKLFDKDLCFGFNNLLSGIKKKVVHHRIMELKKETPCEVSRTEMIATRLKLSVSKYQKLKEREGEIEMEWREAKKGSDSQSK